MGFRGWVFGFRLLVVAAALLGISGISAALVRFLAAFERILVGEVVGQSA
jgi:hypothetical protein